MKKLTGALVLSFSLLLISGCRSAGETRDKEDASTPSSDSNSAAPISTPSPTMNEALKAARDTANHGDAGSGSTGAGTGSDKGTTAEKPLAGGERQAQENCVDEWLTEKKMDRYGHPEGTMYAGGTPLFDERTGETRDRLDYVYERQPEAKKACAGAGAQTPQNTPPKTK